MTETYIDQIRSIISIAFQADRSAGIEGVAQFLLRDSESDSWALQVIDKQAIAKPGIDADANVTITMTVQDCAQLFEGKLDPAKAFMQGRIKLSGDMAFAMKLISLFNLGKV